MLQATRSAAAAGLACALLASCATAPRNPPIAVWIDAEPEAVGVATRLEKLLRKDGFTLVRGAEGAQRVLHLGYRDLEPALRTLGREGIYTIAVDGKTYSSPDLRCLSEPDRSPFDCHADAFLRDLREAGVLPAP